jgi:hypothetical protein
LLGGISSLAFAAPLQSSEEVGVPAPSPSETNSEDAMFGVVSSFCTSREDLIFGLLDSPSMCRISPWPFGSDCLSSTPVLRMQPWV